VNVAGVVKGEESLPNEWLQDKLFVAALLYQAGTRHEAANKISEVFLYNMGDEKVRARKSGINVRVLQTCTREERLWCRSVSHQQSKKDKVQKHNNNSGVNPCARGEGCFFVWRG